MNFGFLIILFDMLLLAFLVIAVIYFIVKRIETKKNEDFEVRDN